MIYGKGMKRGSEDIQLVILLIKNCVDHQNFTMFLQPPIDLREMSCDCYIHLTQPKRIQMVDFLITTQTMQS